MRNLNLKTDLTWHDVTLRTALVIITVAAIVWFMPRDTLVNYKVEPNKVWRYSDLTAQFDFPVYKSDTTIQREQAEVLVGFQPYYVYDNEVAPRQEQRFADEIGRLHVGLGYQFLNTAKKRLAELYQHGIVDTKEPLGGDADSVHSLRRIDDKEVYILTASQVLTPMQAYEALAKDPILGLYPDALARIGLNDYLEPNLIYDEERSESSRLDLLNSVPQASGVVQRGQKIISQGEVVTPQAYQAIESYLKEMERRHQSESGLTMSVVGEVIYVFILIVIFTIYLSVYRSDYFERMRSTGMIYSLIVVSTVMASLLVGHNLLHIYILPFAIVPIFIRVFMDSRTAFLAHVTVVLICSCILQRPLEFIVVEMVAGLTAIYSLRELSSRSQLFWTAIATTAAAMMTNLAIFLIRNDDLSRLDHSEFVYLTLCGIIIFCCYPLLYVVEKSFGFISDITLIELSDMNKEPLRLMSEVAPGTFQHSIQVGNLAAEIARKIGANPQLVRTGALYHDIGKTQNPIYFTENQSGGISPHDRLSYIESAQLIISHVTEGLKLADKYNLPLQIRDLIATHHGQGKAKYFYIKYKNEHPDEPVDDLLFTYPGPNPFTKEQAVLMMADAVEAASRSLPNYTEQSIRNLVGRIIDGMVDDGYFRECPVTFRDIQYAKTVLIEKLKTIYHTRISYPEENKSKDN
ncbi:MAG: HDIG domain-containing protein [Prevotella sp.]|nr:HDIG domain-containing protein [Prevotella sp.]